MLPATADGLYAAWLDAVLTVDAQPVDARFPLVCFDESGTELQQAYRPPPRSRPGRPARIDHPFVHTGSSTFMRFGVPWLGWRHIKLTERRTARDFGLAMRDLVDRHCPDAERITVVLDKLTIHHKGAISKTFAPAVASRVTSRLVFVHTPNHGSWVNMADLEVRAVKAQGRARRIPDRPTVLRQITAWVADRNAHQVIVRWSFTVTDAHPTMPQVSPHQPDTYPVSHHSA